MGKGPSCWFEQILINNGNDFITGGRLNEKLVIRNIDRIVSDIIEGRIDYNLYGYCILYPAVFDTLCAYCNNQLVQKQATLYCLGYTMMQVNMGAIRCDLGVRIDTDGANGEVPAITEGMKRNIMVSIDETRKEVNKYVCLTFYLDRVRMTNNVFELGFVTNLLKQKQQPYNKRR